MLKYDKPIQINCIGLSYFNFIYKGVSKMKKLLSFIIVLCMIMVSVPISASATNVCTPYNGDNSEDQNYLVAASSIKSYLSKSDDDTIMRVQASDDIEGFFVEYYDKEYNLLSDEIIEQELPIFGGFYESDSNYFLVTGQNNPDELSSVEVFRITKYDKNWNRVDSVGVYNCNTTIPFNAGSLRMTMCGDILIVHTAHQMYMTSDGLNHQANITIGVNTTTMEITKCSSAISNTSTGYVSHSFNQFIQLDGNNVVTVDHGDAYPRSIVLIKHSADASTGQFSNGCKVIDVLKFPGAIGENYTGASIGGFEISSSAYLIAGNTVEQDSSYYTNTTRNIFVAAVTDSGTTINQITDYAEGETTTSTPQFVKIATDKYMLMWSRENTIYYTTIDANGNQTSSIYSMDGELSDCVPVVIDDKLVWYVWDNTKTIFYEINLNSLSSTNTKTLETGHHYECESVVDEVSTLICTKCGNVTTVSVPTSMSVWWKSGSDTSGNYYSSMPSNLEVGETLKTMIKFSPTSAETNEDYEVIISDESVLSYKVESVYSGQILGAFNLLKGGTTNITIRHKYNPSLTATYCVTVCSDDTDPENAHSYEIVSVTDGVSTIKCTKCGTTTIILVPTSMSVWWQAENDTSGYYHGSIPNNLKAGQTLNSMVIFSPSNTEIDKDMDVIISDESVLNYELKSVYSSGHVMGVFNLLKAGTASVTFRHKYNPSLTATYKITVESNATGVTLDKSSLSMTVGDTYTLQPIFTPEGTSAVCNWSSSDTDVATVDSTGTITAKKSGTAIITLETDNGLTASCTITVEDKEDIVLGDVNGDNQISLLDALLVLQYGVNKVEFNDKQMQCADVDCSGSVDVADAILIQRYVVGLITSF